MLAANSLAASMAVSSIARQAAPRGSVVHLLVVLTLIPALSLPVFSWLFIQDRLRVSSGAARIEAGLVDVTGLDRVREALMLETEGRVAQRMIVGLRLTSAERDATLRGDPGQLLNSFRNDTDSAFAQMRTAPLISIPGGAATLEALGRRLDAARSAAEAAAPPTATARLTALPPTMNAFNAIISDVQALEQAALYRISSGQLGASSARLLRATGQIQAVGNLAFQVTLQQIHYFGLLFAGRRQDQLAALTTVTGSVDTQLGAVPSGPYLSASARVLWKNLLADPQVASYLTAVRSYILASTRGDVQEVTSLASIVRSGTGARAVIAQLSHLMAVSIAEGVRQAHHDRVVAEHRARTALIATLLTLLATLVVLVVIGGRIRSRLSELACSAQRLSAGQLELMAIRGPREVAFVSRGLNDAVLSLRDISIKADLISRGDIRSPLLERLSPGPLGAAMEVSFRRAVATMRERERLQMELAYQATHDPLTGLVNRSQAERQLTAALRQAQAEKGRIGLLFVDLDHFKACNDTYGHHAGDHVLRICAQRMNEQIRACDVACRLGGDEFVVILKRVGEDIDAVSAGDRIVSAVREPIPYLDHELRVSASVGISVWPTSGVASLPSDRSEVAAEVLAESILGEADRALYRAKASGRNVAVF